LNRISLVNLDPGTYHLRVRSRDVYGALSENEHSIELVIEPAWYQTMWFSACIVLMSMAVIYLLYRYRVRQLLKVERIRNNISRDLHDDIGATLSSVNITSSIIQKRSADGEMVHLVRDMREQIREAQQSLDEIVWNVNPNNDTLEKLFARMRRYASDILDRAGMKFRIEMPESAQGIRLSIEQRRDLYLVFKEGINNVAKHSGAEFAHIVVSLSGKRLEMSVKDDGRGFDTTLKSDRNGIGNMRKRSEQLQGVLKVYSAPGRGTELKLEVDL
jgi:signal transduction histidine kinase